MEPGHHRRAFGRQVEMCERHVGRGHVVVGVDVRGQVRRGDRMAHEAEPDAFRGGEEVIEQRSLLRRGQQRKGGDGGVSNGSAEACQLLFVARGCIVDGEGPGGVDAAGVARAERGRSIIAELVLAIIGGDNGAGRDASNGQRGRCSHRDTDQPSEAAGDMHSIGSRSVVDIASVATITTLYLKLNDVHLRLPSRAEA